MIAGEEKSLIHFIVRYVFEHDTGDIDREFCQPEMAAGRCTMEAGNIDVDMCTQCLIGLFKQRVSASTEKKKLYK